MSQYQDWLGFVQGALWSFGVTAIKEAKNDNRSSEKAGAP